MKDDMKIKEIEWNDIAKGKYDSELGDRFVNLWKGKIDMKRFLQGYGGYMVLDNGRYNMVDHAHIAMLCNISVDFKAMYDYDYDVTETKITAPPGIKDRLSEATVFGVDSCSVSFVNEKDEVTVVDINYITNFIKTFGVPDNVLCAEATPIILVYGDMDIYLAPRIGTGEGEIPTTYSFDFKQWCPQLYGKKFDEPTSKQLLSLIHSMPDDSTISELMDRIAGMRLSKGRTVDMTKYM